MNIIENNSFCGIRKNFSLSSSDMEALTYLYLPILGSNAYSLYISLYHYSSIVQKIAGFLHDDLLGYLHMDASDFLLARTKLEGIGLLESFRQETKNSENQIKVKYVYSILPPASPRKFFQDIFLRALLNDSIGNKKYFFLQSYFNVDQRELDDSFVNVSASFKDVYSVNVSEGDTSLEPVMSSLEDKSYKSQCSFDKKALLKKLKELQFDINIIEPYMKDIENLCVLYAPNLNDVIRLILQNTSSDGEFYLSLFNKDIRSLNKFTVKKKNTQSAEEINGNSEIAKLVAVFNAMTPNEYLGVKYAGNPAPFMLKEIEHLKNDLGFLNPVINVILDYCLRKTNGEFNVEYIDKVAYTLSSLSATDAYDAMMKLNSRDFEVSQKKRRKKTVESKNKKTEEIREDKPIDVNLDDFDKEFSI